MTDPIPVTPPSAGVNQGTPQRARWTKIALIVSVALNLAVAGLMLGAWLGDGPRKGMPRDMAFGPFSDAFSEADRKALRKALTERAGEFRTSREAARAEFVTLLTALRAEPFDPAALGAALTAIETRSAERLELGRSLIEARLAEMSEADRLAFADRLEQSLPRGP